YEILKPPKSPTPSQPSVSPPSMVPYNNGCPNASTTENTSAHTIVKPRALSLHFIIRSLMEL
nr:hypothetical protein [Tanacetum cinerariifolium]